LFEHILILDILILATSNIRWREQKITMSTTWVASGHSELKKGHVLALAHHLGYTAKALELQL
jgi:hypothetical protein